MNVIRKLSKGVLAWVLSISLFLLASFVAASVTIVNPSYIKQTLVKTAFYDNIVQSTLSLATSANPGINSQQAGDAIPQEVIPIIQKVLTPTFLQTTTESLIDGTFVWLKGDAPQPTFIIKTADVKTSLTNELSVYILNRFNALPVCSSIPTTTDPLAATCRSKTLLTKTDADQHALSFVNQLPFLDKPEISLASIDTNNSFASNPAATKIPGAYKSIQLAPYVIGALILLSSVGVYLLSINHHRAIKTIGTTFLWAGLLLVVTGAITLIISGKFKAGFIGSGNDAQVAFVTTIFSPILLRVGNSFALVALYIGAAYAVISALCYFVAHKLNLRHQQEQQITQDSADNI